jgi:hypothetical protein
MGGWWLWWRDFRQSQATCMCSPVAQLEETFIVIGITIYIIISQPVCHDGNESMPLEFVTFGDITVFFSFTNYVCLWKHSGLSLRQTVNHALGFC